MRWSSWIITVRFVTGTLLGQGSWELTMKIIIQRCQRKRRRRPCLQTGVNEVRRKISPSKMNLSASMSQWSAQSVTLLVQTLKNFRHTLKVRIICPLTRWFVVNESLANGSACTSTVWNIWTRTTSSANFAIKRSPTVTVCKVTAGSSTRPSRSDLSSAMYVAMLTLKSTC